MHIHVSKTPKEEIERKLTFLAFLFQINLLFFYLLSLFAFYSAKYWKIILFVILYTLICPLVTFFWIPPSRVIVVTPKIARLNAPPPRTVTPYGP